MSRIRTETSKLFCMTSVFYKMVKADTQSSKRKGKRIFTILELCMLLSSSFSLSYFLNLTPCLVPEAK